MTLSKTSVLKAAPGSVSCQLAGEVVVLNADSGKYYALNSVGGQIWQWLQDPCTVASLQERLIREYDVSEEQCEKQLATLLNTLAEHGLVQA